MEISNSLRTSDGSAASVLFRGSDVGVHNESVVEELDSTLTTCRVMDYVVFKTFHTSPVSASLTFGLCLMFGALLAAAMALCLWSLVDIVRERRRQTRLSHIVELPMPVQKNRDFDLKFDFKSNGNGSGASLAKKEMPSDMVTRQISFQSSQDSPPQSDSPSPSPTVLPESSASAVPEEAGLGLLLVGLEYCANSETSQTGDLIVHLRQGSSLPAMDACGTSDPYVKLSLLPNHKSKFETKVHTKTLNPIFDEKFTFTSVEKVQEKQLSMMVYDFNRFSKDQPIGRVLVNLGDISFSTISELWYPIQSLNDDNDDSGRLGSLLVALSYIPPMGRLTVQIVQAMDLKRMDLMGLSDPFVKLAVMMEGKMIKKAKTSRKMHTLNPIFNETFVFDLVPFDQIQKVSLALTVMDYDRIGSSDRIGKVLLGPKADGTPGAHWNEMLAKPRQTIKRWHLLKPCW